MNWLARLKSEKAPGTHATKPTKPPQGGEKGGSVGFVAYSPAPFQKIDLLDSMAANDAQAIRGGKVAASMEPASVAIESAQAPAADSECAEQYAPAHEADMAMSRAEADTFTDRRARFLECGQPLEDAERLAEKLVIRDRERDDRRLCLECTYYGSTGRCVAAATGRLPGVSARLEPVPTVLQRCEAFGLRKGLV